MAEVTHQGTSVWKSTTGSRWRWAVASYVCARWEPVFALPVLALFVAMALILPSTNIDIFNSPDESSNYLFVKAMAEEGHPWYTPDYVHMDGENLLHPRGALTHEGRVVPFNYLGVPVLYGLLYVVIGDGLRYLGVVLAAVIVWSLYRSSSLLFGAKAWEAGVIALSVVPFIYYLNRPYMNATPAITMTLLGTWFFARYLRRSNTVDLIVASGVAAFACLFRYEYVLFVSPLALWALYFKHRTLLSKAYVRDVAIFGGGMFVVFVLPVMALNQWVYGDWSTYGYALFNDVYFPDRSAAEGASYFESGVTKLRSILLPSYPFSASEVAGNLPRLTLWFMPVLTVLGAIGVFKYLGERRFSWRLLVPIVALSLYMLLYRGSGETWNATGTEAALNTAVIRYWLLFYCLLAFAAVYGLRRVTEAPVKIAIVLGLLLSGPIYVYTLAEGSLKYEREVMHASKRWSETVLVPNTEENAVIFASRNDKRLVPYRDTATWWNGEEFYNSEKLAASMSRLANSGRPVYLYREREVDLPELRKELAERHYSATEVGDTGLYRIARVTARR